MNMTRSLQRSINTMINQAVDNAPYDKTRVGTVLERNEDNTYTIKVDGVIYRKISIVNGFKANVGDVVKVVIPTNNPSQMFISAVRYITETILIGEIKMYAGDNEPEGWLLCDGRELLISDYPGLYNAIGDVYGTPSDSDHFLLPDLRGRAPIGAGQGANLSNRTLGEPVGAETHQLTVDEMPNHRHKQVDTPFFQSNRTMPSGAYTLADSKTSNVYTEYTGGDQEHNNMQPSLGLNFLIYHGQH